MQTTHPHSAKNVFPQKKIHHRGIFSHWAFEFWGWATSAFWVFRLQSGSEAHRKTPGSTPRAPPTGCCCTALQTPGRRHCTPDGANPLTPRSLRRSRTPVLPAPPDIAPPPSQGNSNSNSNSVGTRGDEIGEKPNWRWRWRWRVWRWMVSEADGGGSGDEERQPSP